VAEDAMKRKGWDVSRRTLRVVVAGALLCVGLIVGSVSAGSDAISKVRGALVAEAYGASTVDERVEQFGESTSERLEPYFDKAGVSYPPAEVLLVGLKKEERLEVYAADDGGELAFIRSYPILAASGDSGPKLRQGDRQVPEGIYTIELLNPNSRFHLSMRVNYPNAFDRRQARAEGRSDPGGDIYIHGDAVSIGCLAMGDKVAEELFVLAALTGVGDVDILLSPVDFRTTDFSADTLDDAPDWIEEVYDELRARIRALPKE
jgi:hypothetical protein